MDFILGNILRYLYFHQTSGLLYRTTYSIDSTKAHILVFGSSRANHHYVPEIFEDNLEMSFYNTGRDGNFLLYNYAIFKAIVARYNPRIVIFDLNPDELVFDPNEYDRLSSLLPYYKNHPEIRDIICMKSHYEKLKLVSSIYPFNSSILTIGIGNIERNKLRKSDRKGYVALKGYMSNTRLNYIETMDGTLDPNKVNALNDIIGYCKTNNIKLYFIQSPIFARVKSIDGLNTLEQIISKNNAKYVSFVNDPVFLASPMYFKDQSHLNEIGANIFSKIVVRRILN